MHSGGSCTDPCESSALVLALQPLTVRHPGQTPLYYVQQLESRNMPRMTQTGPLCRPLPWAMDLHALSHGELRNLEPCVLNLVFSLRRSFRRLFLFS
jgi:hypothetical protein